MAYNLATNTSTWEVTPNESNNIVLKTSGHYLTKNITIKKLNSAIGSVTMTAGSGSVTGSNATLSDTNTSGISVTGKGNVSATAKVTTAGYAPINNSFASGASTSSNEATKYLTGVTLTAPTSGENIFTITVPNGTDDTVTFTFKVDSSSNVWVE